MNFQKVADLAKLAIETKAQGFSTDEIQEEIERSAGLPQTTRFYNDVLDGNQSVGRFIDGKHKYFRAKLEECEPFTAKHICPHF